MQLHEIEAWALNIIDRVRKNQPVEDSRVELKATWPEAPKAARRIAGHANAAGGSVVLWLIGVDEKIGVKGVDATELSKWYPRVKSQFDGLAPNLIDINIPTEGATVVALLFETDRKPFVVKNPEGGAIQFEVPWRENTAIRSATREDLIRLLSPLQILPNFEVIECRLKARKGSPATHEQNIHHLVWTLDVDLYTIPNDGNRVVIPFHYCKAGFDVPGYATLPFFSQIKLSPIPIRSGWRNPTTNYYSHTIIKSDTEVIIDGPGTIRFQAEVKTGLLENEPAKDANISLSIGAINSANTFVTKENLHFYCSENQNTDAVGKWCLRFVDEDET